MIKRYTVMFDLEVDTQDCHPDLPRGRSEAIETVRREVREWLADFDLGSISGYVRVEEASSSPLAEPARAGEE